MVEQKTISTIFGVLFFLSLIAIAVLTYLYLTRKPSPKPVVDEKCKNVSCGLHGICKEGVCYCTNGWTGSACETAPVNPCAAIQCGQHGSCDPKTSLCRCVDGYTGEHCEFAPSSNIKPRATSVSDCGYLEQTHGWFDATNQGAKNDYCRLVGDPQTGLFFSCQLAVNPGETPVAYTPAGKYMAKDLKLKGCESLKPGDPCFDPNAKERSCNLPISADK